MIVIVLSATPARLRGALTRWLVEVSTGVYVGRVSARVRDQLWELIENNLERGRATLVYRAHNEQGFCIKSSGHDWIPIDHEGLQIMMQLQAERSSLSNKTRSLDGASSGWSVASRLRRFGNASERILGTE